MKTTTKNIYDYKNVKNVSAIALIKDGRLVGKIVANWSDNPNGTVCTAQVMLWDDVISKQINKVTTLLNGEDWEHDVMMIGKASGYGYDKLSSAIASALRVGGISHLIKVEGASGNQEQAFKDAGFGYCTIC